jgi:hypothetical protein
VALTYAVTEGRLELSASGTHAASDEVAVYEKIRADPRIGSDLGLLVDASRYNPDGLPPTEAESRIRRFVDAMHAKTAPVCAVVIRPNTPHRAQAGLVRFVGFTRGMRVATFDSIDGARRWLDTALDARRAGRPALEVMAVVRECSYCGKPAYLDIVARPGAPTVTPYSCPYDECGGTNLTEVSGSISAVRRR